MSDVFPNPSVVADSPELNLPAEVDAVIRDFLTTEFSTVARDGSPLAVQVVSL